MKNLNSQQLPVKSFQVSCLSRLGILIGFIGSIYKKKVKAVKPSPMFLIVTNDKCQWNFKGSKKGGQNV